MKIILWILGFGILYWLTADLSPIASLTIVMVYYLSKISWQIQDSERQRRVDEWNKRQEKWQ